jgi:hypothetical protein
MEWRPAAGFPDYEIRCDGVVRRSVPDSRGLCEGQTIKDRPYGKYGHRLITLSLDRKRVDVAVHVLVALTFVGPRPTSRHEVAHNDGVPWHNLYTNLRWDTRKGNHSDRRAHGTSPVGEANGRSRLTVVQVAEIKAALIAQPYGIGRKLAEKYDVGMSTISRIKHDVGWGLRE